MGSEQNRFPQQQQQQPPPPRRKRWGGCLGGLSCFGMQNGGRRVVPASRIPETNALANQPNGPQPVGVTNQTTTLAPSLLAPPSSPVSFSNSALPSTVQSPNCFLSANSPGGPSSTMFATGPYAHETQPVSPPVFSTYTTEPSTAPLTPPPELAHLTTPSSPDVPYAQFLSSAVNLRNRGKPNYTVSDLQTTYSLYPGSPASSLISPVSRTTGDGLYLSVTEQESSPRCNPSIASHLDYPKSESGRLLGVDTNNTSKTSRDSNFFCPATFAQFYLDPSSFPHSGGRLSVSRESDTYSNGANVHQNRQNKVCKQEAEEIEAYRASFGFSADEIVTTTQYVEISDVMDDSFTIMPFTSNATHVEESILPVSVDDRSIAEKTHPYLANRGNCKLEADHVGEGICCEVSSSSNGFEGAESGLQHGDVSRRSKPSNRILIDDGVIFSTRGVSRISRKYHLGLSSSDAEVEYRRGKSLREGRHFVQHG